jgi:DNA-binding response OmpR family regulator
VTKQVNAQHIQSSFLPDISFRRILLVEDEPDIAELLILLLSDEGAEVITFHDAETALAQIESLRPDILLCNVKLPHHDGHWLIKQLRLHSCPFLQHLPAIAITSYTRDFPMSLALNAGFDRYLSKIEDLDEIVSEIFELLSHHP